MGEHYENAPELLREIANQQRLEKRNRLRSRADELNALYAWPRYAVEEGLDFKPGSAGWERAELLARRRFGPRVYMRVDLQASKQSPGWWAITAWVGDEKGGTCDDLIAHATVCEAFSEQPRGAVTWTVVYGVVRDGEQQTVVTTVGAETTEDARLAARRKEAAREGPEFGFVVILCVKGGCLYRE